MPAQSIKGNRERAPSPLRIFSPRELCETGAWFFGTLPQEIRRRSDLSDAAKVMYSALAEMEATMPEVRPGLKRLALEIGGSRRTAIRAINELRGKKLIDVIEQPRKGFRAVDSTNLYTFLLNPKFLPETFKAITGAKNVTSDKSVTSAESGTGDKNGLELVTKMVPSWCQNCHPSKTIEKDHRERPGKPLDQALQLTAERLYAHHPHGAYSRRDLSQNEIVKELRTILRHKSLRGDAAISYLDELANYHEALSRSEEWTNEGGKYAKALSNWLAPTKNRYDPKPLPHNGAHKAERRGLKAGEIE